MRDKDILTPSSLSCLRRCPRQYYYRYELGLSRVRTSDALRIGTEFHLGLELYNKGYEATKILESIGADYKIIPEWATPYDWLVEGEIVCQLLTGHFWRYEQDDVQVIETERTFELPLVNPSTGRTSRAFTIAGKIDVIGQLADGRTIVREYKTSGEDIGPTSNYWLRLRCDPQISQYVLATQALGYDVATVLYDVTRKPTIAPWRATPPEKRKYTKDGYLYAGQREYDETPEEFGIRFLADIGERPEYYFQRRELPILEDELAEFQVELWHQAKQLLQMRLYGRWYRSIDRFNCANCQFAELCLNAVHVAPDVVPSGFEFLGNRHPELSIGDDNDQPTD